MLAAETAFEALKKQDFSAATLSDYQKRVESSWIKDELWKVRNFHQGFEHGFWRGMLHAGLQQITAGRGLRDRYPSTPGYQRMKKLAVLSADGGDEAHLLGDAKGDGKLTFDKLTDLYHSGTKHEEDQPAHLIIHDTNVCESRCVVEYGSPCQRFCPANVYELLDDSSAPNGKRISLNPSNCVHCKACDIQDPYQIITWVPPEGGGGQTTSQMLVRFRQDVIDLQPKAVVILAGTNDIAGNTGPISNEDIESNFTDLAELARAHNIHLIFSSILPVHNYTPKSQDF